MTLSETAAAEAAMQKRVAAKAALAELPESGIIGLGTGSTAKLFIEELALLVKAGRKFSGVPTSEASGVQARSLGISLLDEIGPWDIAVTVDGADEVDANLNLIKGGGAAHLREKIINQSSRRNVIIVDKSKLSQRLGEKWPVPVEVVTFAHKATAFHLAKFGTPVLRLRDGAPLKTDSGNYIYDLKTGPLDEPRALDLQLKSIPGVVETGLFIGRCDVVLVAGEGSVTRLVPSPK